MEPRWFILADDLTGAADSAIAFACRQMPARVVWGDARPEDHMDAMALAYDAASRELDAAEAVRRHRDALRRFQVPRQRVFKKIDSTLRGHPADEIAAMLDVMLSHESQARIVLAPAFPAAGRTVRDGQVCVDGVPLPFTEFWPADRNPKLGNLLNLMESVGIPTHPVPLSAIRAGDRALRSALLNGVHPAASASVAVCDSETGDDLERIAAASVDEGGTLFIGSAGLAHALASCVARRSARRTMPRLRESEMAGALIVVGSRAPASRAALGLLRTLEGVEGFSVTDAMLREDLRSPANVALAQTIGSSLMRGSDVVIDIAQDHASGRPGTPDVVAALARVLAVPARQASALVATGGETAAALFKSIGVTGLRLVDEIEPGIPLGLTLGTIAVPVVTKAGGFGNEECLRRIVTRLRFIRQTGTVA